LKQIVCWKIPTFLPSEKNEARLQQRCGRASFLSLQAAAGAAQ